MTIDEASILKGAFDELHGTMGLEYFDDPGDFEVAILAEARGFHEEAGDARTMGCAEVAARMILAAYDLNDTSFCDFSSAYWEHHARPSPPKPKWKDHGRDSLGGLCLEYAADLSEHDPSLIFRRVDSNILVRVRPDICGAGHPYHAVEWATDPSIPTGEEDE